MKATTTTMRTAGWALMCSICLNFLATMTAQAQRSDYARLARQNERPHTELSVFTLPADSSGYLKMITAFQFSNQFFSFKKRNSSTNQMEYMSPIQLNLEVFQSPKKNLKPNKQINVDGLESVGRSVWRDTAYAKDYQATKSNTEGINGSMQLNIRPGDYTYLLQLNQNDESDARNSHTRNIHIKPYDEQHRNNILYVKNVNNASNPTNLTLFNKGNKVTYGKDFYAFIHIPMAIKDKKFNVKVERIHAGEKDTTDIEQVFEKQLNSGELMQHIIPRLQSRSENLILRLHEQNEGYNYGLVKIPNTNFPNAVYRLSVRTGNASKPLLTGIFQSNWENIPTSLLSLDVATDMLRFITDKATIKNISSGSKMQREKKFRDFWKAKDPTPNTEFNELEAEYYRRIDYSFKNFGSPENAGYDSDRGRIYINYGPPQSTSRKYPPGGATTEIWKYSNQTFVFKATTSFGDYQLVSKKNK